MIARSSTHTHTHTVGTVKRKGFTIIQLVIGMLIFAILTGIAFFGISIYTAQANETRVASDLGTFEVAIKDYMLNNPGACSDGTLSPVGLNHYLTKENALALDEADPNKDDLGTEISVAAGVKSEAAYKKLSVLEDPWGHQYRVVIRNNADRTTEEGEYGAKGTDRAFIYVYSMGKDGKGAANDTKQDDSVLCVQYSDGEVYSRSYLPSDGKNQAIAAPAYTYWNKDENGKHSVMKDSIFAVGAVDPSKAPGKENGSSGGIGGGGSNVTSGYAGWYVTDDYMYARTPTAGNDMGFTSIEEGQRFVREVYTKLTTGMSWDEYVRDALSNPSNEGKTESDIADAAYAEVGLDKNTFVPATLGDEWAVMVIDPEKTKYGALETMINGYPVTSLAETFRDCTNMKKAPNIPSSVKNMTSTFEGCTSLTGTITLDCELTGLGDCFKNTVKPIVLTGGSSNLYNLAATGNNGNVTVKKNTAPIHGSADYSSFYQEKGDYFYMRKVISGNAVGAPTIESAQAFVKDVYIEMLTGWGGNRMTYDEFLVANDMSEEDLWEALQITEGTFEPAILKDEWSVKVTDGNKSSYGTIESYINGMPVTDMDNTYENCTSLKVAPAIPSTVTRLYGTYFGCSSLTEAPVIPNSVKDMTFTFQMCEALKTAPIIPNSVQILKGAFRYCSSLEGVVTINADPTGDCTGLFEGTTQDIYLEGSSTFDFLANNIDSSIADGTNVHLAHEWNLTAPGQWTCSRSSCHATATSESECSRYGCTNTAQ